MDGTPHEPVHVRPVEPAGGDAVLCVIREAFGAVDPATGTDYPEVWWRHDSTGLRDPDLAEVEKALGTARPSACRTGVR